VSDPTPETYFIRGADCWGWATWRDRWKEYNPDGAALLRELKARDLCHAFDFDGTTGFVRMLEDQIAGRNNSWAVRWHASCFLRDLLILYPGRALAHNIGQDGSGTHTLSQDDTFNVTLSDTPVRVGGIAVQEDPIARDAICRYFRKRQSSGALSRKAFRDAVVRRLPRRVVHVLRLIRNWIRARQTFR
jgi:hypothetical protein